MPSGLEWSIIGKGTLALFETGKSILVHRTTRNKDATATLDLRGVAWQKRIKLLR
jgi:hypothetical protein